MSAREDGERTRYNSSFTRRKLGKTRVDFIAEIFKSFFRVMIIFFWPVVIENYAKNTKTKFSQIIKLPSHEAGCR